MSKDRPQQNVYISNKKDLQQQTTNKTKIKRF